MKIQRFRERVAAAVLAGVLVVGGCGSSDGEGAPRSASTPPEVSREVPVEATDTPPTSPPAVPAGESPSSPDAWTAGRVAADHEVEGVAILRELRVARNEGFDRVVFVFEDEQIPAYTVEYVDRPVRACGSGHVVEIAGDGWLDVRFTPARAYTEEGVATVRERDRRYDHPVIRQLRNTCDFEAHLEWVIGVGSPNRFRVLELREPARVVVDVRH